MDNSTENVTLISAFVNDILNIYKGKRRFEEKLQKMTEGYDLSDPMAPVPMKLYNDICNWIEDEIGVINTKKVGKQIGETAYANKVQMNLVKEGCSPAEMMEALKKVASIVIQDPKNRGWEIVENQDKKIVMRRTQTFNSTLQFGLLHGLMKKTNALGVNITYDKSVANGDSYDDYLITWS
jgi:hypothetical protein